ncbi:MAG: hypothetical protein AAF663_00775 [Planctomycetota bacterium]
MRRSRSHLDHLAISRRYKTTVRPAGRARFGGFAAGIVGQRMLAAVREANDEVVEPLSASKKVLKQVVAAFAAAAEGRSVDSLLCSPALTHRFVLRCHQRGIEWSEQRLLRQIMAIRKNPRLYGISLPRSTKREPLSAATREAALPGVEIALATMKYRHQASIDDLLVDPVLRQEFDRLTENFAPRASVEARRKAALYLRKVRLKQSHQEIDLRGELKLDRLSRRLRDAGSVRSIDLDAIEQTSGLFALQIRSSSKPYLYCGTGAYLRSSVRLVAREDLWNVVADGLLPSVDPAEMRVRVFEQSTLDDLPIATWAELLIDRKRPYFNFRPAA